jgi:hypothetical protein
LIFEKLKHGYEPIIANGKRYESINDAVDADEANNRLTAMRRLRNIKFKDWNYLAPTKVIAK